MKHRLVFKLFSFISTFSILFNSFYAPLYILAQEQQALEPTPTPAESPTTPVPSDNPATPIPTEDPTPALTDAPVTSTPTPTDNLMTPTPTSTFQPTDESTPLVSPSGTVLGEASQITPTPSGNEEIEGEKKLDVFVLENTDANDVEKELLPDFDYTELSSATLTTDKFDYAPTDAVVITGSGFVSNTTYELVITSATGNFRFSDNVLSNESGGFIYTYQLDGVYRPEYKVEIFDISGKLITSTFFFDSKAGKIKICHATNSHSKPYIKNKPDIKNDGSLSGGHLNHTGPLWYLGITEKWGDIIPPYQSGNFSYPGMNWNAQGQAIWNNDCKIPTPSPTPTPCVEGQTWASGVFDFEQGTKKNGDPVEDDRSDPDNALGVPDSPQPTIKFFSLGKDGWIILTFAGWILDVNGSDLSFHEVTWGRDSYPVEKAKVEVSQNGTDWFGSWEVTNKDGGNGVGYVDFSATGLPWIKYVRITDITDYSLHGNDADGYDLDAVDGVSQVCQQPQPSVTPTPTPTLTPTPTPQPYCGDGKINQNSEQCDGTDGVTQGRNFCTSTCKLIPIYTGGRTCSNGKVPVLRSELSRTISSTSTSPVTVNLPNVNEYLFEVIGDYGYGGVPTNNQVHRADAGYATAEDAGSAWAALRHDIGIEPGAIYRGVTSLLSDFGTGNMGVVDWGAYSPTHIYTVVNTPASISDTTFRFVISDWYSDWYNGGGNNNQGGMWDNEGSLTLNVYECLSSTNVSGQKYNDHNYNGQKDNSEPGLEDWTIYLAKKVDEVNVPALNMPTIPSNITLASGTKYLLRVSGTFGAGDNITGDAKYSVRSPNTYWTDSVQNYESYGPTLLDLQINNSSVNWGTYNPSHIYWLTYTGTGSPINFRIYDIYPPNNSGQLNVKIYQVIDETQTDSSGNYQFNYNGELTGEVIVAEETQSGWIQTAPGEGYCPISSYQQNTCDFGNAAGKGWIIVEKQTIPDGSDQSFEFSGAVSGSLIDNQRLVSQELPAGGYSVGEGTVEGWDLSDITCDDPTQNSYSNLPSAPTATINLAAGETVTCTFTNTKRGSISGYKWEDLDGNGVWDNDEPGISEWIIFIDEDSDGVLGDEETSLITDDNGYYEFENLASGTYSVCETLKDGWERTYPSNSDCHTVTVVAGQETGNVNFGNFKLGVIQGRKYDDLNGDGTRDSGEPYLDGWTIRLYRGEDEGWSLVDTKSTGHTGVLGQYKFINLEPGRYKVCEVMQNGWVQTSPSGPTNRVASDEAPRCRITSITQSGQVRRARNFGNIHYGSISGYKYEDKNGNGQQDENETNLLSGWAIELRNEENDLVKSTTTGSDGHYQFTDVLPGNYRVCEKFNLNPGDPSYGWWATDPAGGYTTGACKEVVVSAGQDSEVNFGNFKGVFIGGYKFEDTNGDGEWDFFEPEMNGWIIRLYKLTVQHCDEGSDPDCVEGEHWSAVGSHPTGLLHPQIGKYGWYTNGPGTYFVCEVITDHLGWIQTYPSASNGVPNQSGNDDEAPYCHRIDVSSGVDIYRNFGNFKLGKIYGYKYDEDGETGLNGWNIFIDGDGDGKLDEGETVVRTGDGEWRDGYFEFTGLTAGEYSICEEEQNGWQRMYPLGTNCQSVSVTSGGETEVYFQNRKVVLGLTLTKSNDATGSLSAGSVVNYTLVIKNTGNQDLTGVTIKDAPAGGFTYVAGSGKLGTDPITPTISGGYLEWYIGVLGAGEEKTLTYKMQSDSTLVAGTYPNVAIATGIYIPSEYVPPESSEAAIFKPLVVEALAVTEEAETPSEGEKVESNAGVPVNSEVRIASSLSYSTGVGSTGEVLGASTEAVEGAVLPAAGSSTWNLAIALLSLLFGFGLKALSVAVEKNRINTKGIRKGLKKAGVFLASLVLFLVLSTPLKAFSDYVYITKLDSYLNKENFYLSYSALSENPISAQFYVRKDGDATWRTLGSALTGASGQVEVKPADIYGGDAKYFFKVVINGGTASDETSTIIDRNAPDPVRDYRKEKLGDGHYKLYWRNPDNADYDRVKIYRSENKNFTADSSTEVATLWGTAGSEMTSESAAAPGKEYYFAIRAIDKAGNASSVVADPETQVTVVSSAVLGKTTEVSAAEEVKILPKEKKGEVLGEGEEKTEGEEKAGETPPVESPKPQTAGVLGQAIQFAKDRTKLTLFIAFVLGLMSTLAFRALRKRKG